MPCAPAPGGVDDEHRYTPGIPVAYGFGLGTCSLFGYFLADNCALIAAVVCGEQETFLGFDDDGMNRVVSG